MSTFFAIIVFIALNLVPANVKSFDVVDPEGRTLDGKPLEKVVRFTQQPAGSWKAVDLPRDDLGTYILAGQTLKVACPEKKLAGMDLPMGSLLDLSKPIDWATVTQLTSKSGSNFSISRHPNQLSITMDTGTANQPGGKPKTKSIIIRWKEGVPAIPAAPNAAAAGSGR